VKSKRNVRGKYETPQRKKSQLSQNDLCERKKSAKSGHPLRIGTGKRKKRMFPDGVADGPLGRQQERVNSVRIKKKGEDQSKKKARLDGPFD